MKSDAWIESDQNSTCALRDPTLNKLDLQELSKSNASPGLLWSCKGPDLRAVGFPMSFQFIREAKSCLGSSSEVPTIKMAYRNWKGLWKDWSRRTGMKRTTIGSKITGFETRISRPRFLSLPRKLSRRIFQPWKYTAHRPEYRPNRQSHMLEQWPNRTPIDRQS